MSASVHEYERRFSGIPKSMTIDHQWRVVQPGIAGLRTTLTAISMWTLIGGIVVLINGTRLVFDPRKNILEGKYSTTSSMAGRLAGKLISYADLQPWRSSKVEVL